MLSLFNAGTAGTISTTGTTDNTGPADNAGDGDWEFSCRLRRARLDLIVGDPRFSRWFAHAYVGVDE